MPNYQNGLIYKLCCKDANITDIYVGSTTNFKQRKKLHKSVCNNENNKDYNCDVYKFIRENGGFQNWDMVLVEYYPCKTKLELEKREREIIEELKPTLNKIIPTRTKKEYYENNKEQLLEKKKEYNEKNKEQIAEYQKKYNEDNKEKLKEKKKEYYENNKETIKEKHKEYNEKNKEHISEQKKEWRDVNKEKIAEKKKEHYENNKEHILKKKKEHYEKNKEKIAEKAKEKETCE